MDFGYILKRAWQIIWKFKVLWVFGILASCGQAGTSSGGNSSYRMSNQGNAFSNQINQFFNQLSPGVIVTLIVLAIIIILVLVVLSILLGTVGRVGLIRGTVKAEQGADRLTFGELWKEGLVYFWRVFGLNLLIGILIFLAVILLVILGVVLAVGTLGIFLICMLPLICLLIPLAWAIGVIVEQANIALVVENLGITDAIRRGWHVVVDNLGNMIVMWLILGVVIGLIGGAIIGLPLLAVAAPAVIGIANGTAAAVRNGLIISGLLFLAYLPFLLVLSGILRSYTASAWTLTFLRLTNKPAPVVIETPGQPVDDGTLPPQIT